MKPERPGNDDEPVRNILREWTVTSPLPPRFAENVWRRIEDAENALAPASNPTPWNVLQRWLTEMLRRPAFAVAYASVLLMAGLAAGYWHARVDTASWDKALATRYVQAVDPFQNPIPN